VLVLQPGKSPIDEAQATLTQLRRANGKLLGVVFNRIPSNRSHYYGGYRYYSPNAYNAYSKEPVVSSGKKPASQEVANYGPDKQVLAPERSNGHSKKEITISRN
jgi:Mrp family chromosome partitioning ATPase